MSIGTTKITDLHLDCMESVFELLGLNDLLSVADSSKQFYSAACLVYRKKYRKVTTILDRIEWNSALRLPKSKPKEIYMIIQHTTQHLKLLRNFGHLIDILGINFNQLISTEVCAEIENYLTRYCSDSLQRLHIIPNASRFIFQDLQKPFRKLNILDVAIYSRQKIKSQIQFLNEVNLPNVKRISLGYFFFLWPDEKLHYENIEFFSLWPCASQISRYPFSFGNLKHFILEGRCDVNDSLCECIGNIPTLEMLRIMVEGPHVDFNPNSFNRLMELPNIQSNIEVFQFAYNKCISSGDVLRFLRGSQKLKKCFIIGRQKPDSLHFLNFIQAISSNLGVEWKCHHVKMSKNALYFDICYGICDNPCEGVCDLFRLYGGISCFTIRKIN